MAEFVEFDPSKQPRYKVELHAHLDGSVRLTTVWELAEKKGIALGVKTLEGLYDKCRINVPSSLKDFLKPFSLFMPLIVGDADAIERVAYEYCEDAVKQGVLYAEVRYCPHLLSTTHGLPSLGDVKPLSPREVVMCVNKGLSRGSADFNLTVRSILVCFRGHPEWSSEVLDLCEEFRRLGVVGIDIAGDEATGLCSPTDVEVFRRAAMLGIHRTVHAGEAGPAENVKTALRELFAERIGHGYHVVDDPNIYSMAMGMGVHFETCPHSSILTGSVSCSSKKHPIVRFAEDDVSFSISRDDPTIIQKTLDQEYELLRAYGLKEVHIVRANFSAARNCFLPEDEKRQLMTQMNEIYGTYALQGDSDPPCIPPRAMTGGGDY